MSMGNTQDRSGTPRTVSANPMERRGGRSDGTDVNAVDPDGDSVISDTYPNAGSSNPMTRPPKSSPEGQYRRGYVFNDSRNTPPTTDTSAGRLRKIAAPPMPDGPTGTAMPSKRGGTQPPQED